MSVFAATGWQGVTQGGGSPTISDIVITNVDHSEGRDSSAAHNRSDCSNSAAITETPNYKRTRKNSKLQTDIAVNNTTDYLI